MDKTARFIRHPTSARPAKPWRSGDIRHPNDGFTLIELLLVIGIFTILAGFTTINLIKPQTKASVDTTVTTLVADIRQQQLKTMVGDTEGASSAQPHGIFFETNRYTLFKGLSYSSSDPSNFGINLETNVNLTNVTFPSSQVVFSRRSGEVSSFISGSTSITVINTQSNEQKTITLNRYGVMTIN